MLHYAQNPGEIIAICKWVNSQLEEEEDFDKPYAVCVLSKDEEPKILAGAVFTNWDGKNIFLSGAIAKEGIGKVTRECLRDMLMVAYRQPMDCLRITALVSEANKRSQVFMQKLGFTKEGELRDYLGEDTITFLYGMTRKDFLGGKYGRGQRRRRRATS